MRTVPLCGLLALLVSLGLMPHPAAGNGTATVARLTVTVTGLNSASGTVHAALFDSAETFRKTPRRTEVLPIESGRAVWTVDGLATGTYAVTIFHDLNGNGRLDATALGLPAEPVAASGRGGARFGPPTYDQCRFDLGGASQTLALAPRPPVSGRERWTAGAAAIVSRSPYVGDRVKARGVPTLTYLGDRFYLLGITAGYVLTPQKTPRLSAVAQYRFSPYDDNDSEALDGMHAREATMDAGLKAEWRLPRSFDLEARVMADTLARHNGQSAGLQLGRRFTRGAWTCRPSVGIDWLSPNLSRFLYGVGPNEALPGRPVYEPGDTWRAGTGLMLMRSFTARWMTTLMAGVDAYETGFDHSPIVDKRVLWHSLLSVGYKF
jgi:outer membrane protein